MNYRVTRGASSLTTTQFEMAFFAQNDIKLTPRLTMMAGARYELQTNISDHNNFDPRLGFAYAVGRATVIRAGAGIFHQRMVLNILESMRRLNGTHQHEIVIDNPSYPDPFQAGVVRNPSVRVLDPLIRTPYSLATLASVERTFFSNLFVSVQYDHIREVHRLRLRNVNAPMDVTSATPASCKPGQSAATCVRPQPDRGNILSLESTASETADNLRINYRQRFSIFNVSASYTFGRCWLDSNQAQAFGNGNVAAGYGQDGLGLDSYNLKADWARIIQPHHNMNGAVNAQMPLGIFLTGTVTASSARFYTITTGKDDNMDSIVNDRPPGAAAQRRRGSQPSRIQFQYLQGHFLRKRERLAK